MGSYAHDDDLDEYEDDFIDDERDGEIRVKKYSDEEIDEENDEFEEEEEEFEVEEEGISKEALDILKYRQKIKEELRMKKNGGSLDKSIDRGTRPPLSNFGSFFGPSQPVIADRVAQESKALLETRHLAPTAPKASTSQTNGTNVSAASISGAKNGVSRQPSVSQAKSKVQIIKQTRDYSFLMSDDADVPKPNVDREQPRNLASKTDSVPSLAPAKRNIPSSKPGRRVGNGFEQRAPQVCSTRAAPVRNFAPGDKSLVVSSDPRTQLDSRKHAQAQPTKKVGPGTGNGDVRNPMARPLPPKRPLSSIDKKMPMEKKAPVANGGNRCRASPVLKQNVLNGQRQSVEKLSAPGVIRSKERNMSAREQKPNGKLSMRSQSGGVKQDSCIKKRKVEDIDVVRSLIRGIMGVKEDRYLRYDDDDDDKCMETNFDTILKEEKISARIGKKEDEEELAKLMEEERQQQLRKKAKMRKMSQK